LIVASTYLERVSGDMNERSLAFRGVVLLRYGAIACQRFSNVSTVSEEFSSKRAGMRWFCSTAFTRFTEKSSRRRKQRWSADASGHHSIGQG
jgi:hypothetical protein